MEENIIIIGAFVVAAIVSWFLVPRILFIAFQKKLFDVPDSRKIHTGIVPRLGGVTFFPVFVLVFMMTFAFMSSFCDSVKTLINTDVVAECSLLICGMTIIFLVGIGDDLVGVSSNKKFTAQILAATFIPLSGLWINNWYGLFGVYELPVWL